MVLLSIKRAVLVVAAAATCYWLAGQLGPQAGTFVWAVATAGGCALGAVLLRTSPLGRVTWRNRAAGYLIPWGWRLNRGRLWPITVVSWVVWLAIGAAVVLLRPGPAEVMPGVAVRVGLFAAWAIDAAALVYLLGTIRQATPGGRVGTLWKLVVAITLLIGASVGLYLGGLATAALVVGGGPPAVVGGGFGLVLLVLLTVGRNARWN